MGIFLEMAILFFEAHRRACYVLHGHKMVSSFNGEVLETRWRDVDYRLCVHCKSYGFLSLFVFMVPVYAHFVYAACFDGTFYCLVSLYCVHDKSHLSGILTMFVTATLYSNSHCIPCSN